MKECDAVCCLICRQPTSTSQAYHQVQLLYKSTSRGDDGALCNRLLGIGRRDAAQGSADLRVRQSASGGKDATEFLSSKRLSLSVIRFLPTLFAMFLPWPRSWLVTGISTSSWGCDPLRHGHTGYLILRSTATSTPTCCCGLSSRQQTWRRCDTCGNSRTRFRMHAARYISYLKAQMPPGVPTCGRWRLSASEVACGACCAYCCASLHFANPALHLSVNIPTSICPIQIHIQHPSLPSDPILRSLFSSAPAGYPAVDYCHFPFLVLRDTRLSRPSLCNVQCERSANEGHPSAVIHAVYHDSLLRQSATV